MSISKVGRRGQLTLPREVRKRLELREGDHVAFIQEDDGFVLKPLTSSLKDLRGAIPVDGPQDFEEVRRATLAKRATDRH